MRLSLLSLIVISYVPEDVQKFADISNLSYVRTLEPGAKSRIIKHAPERVEAIRWNSLSEDGKCLYTEDFVAMTSDFQVRRAYFFKPDSGDLRLGMTSPYVEDGTRQVNLGFAKIAFMPSEHSAIVVVPTDIVIKKVSLGGADLDGSSTIRSFGVSPDQAQYFRVNQKGASELFVRTESGYQVTSVDFQDVFSVNTKSLESSTYGSKVNKPATHIVGVSESGLLVGYAESVTKSLFVTKGGWDEPIRVRGLQFDRAHAKLAGTSIVLTRWMLYSDGKYRYVQYVTGDYKTWREFPEISNVASSSSGKWVAVQMKANPEKIYLLKNREE